MNSAIQDLKPEPNDLVVVPYDFKVPEGLPFLVHKMKFLLTPSIIKSGHNMSFFENLSAGKILGWLTGNLKEKNEVSATSSTLGKETFQQKWEKEVAIGSGEIPAFFRYSRPLDPKCMTTLGPKGGVTFYIELDAENKTVAFSYSLCHHDDRFNRKVARHITKQRFDNNDWYEIKNYDPDLGVMTNIKNAIKVLQSGNDCSTLELTQFSSMSERLNKYELGLIFERI